MNKLQRYNLKETLHKLNLQYEILMLLFNPEKVYNINYITRRLIDFLAAENIRVLKEKLSSRKTPKIVPNFEALITISFT